MNNLSNKQKGFSLIELSMVLVIASVVVVLFLQARNEDAKRTVDEKIALKTIEEIRRIGVAAGNYFIEHSDTWPNETASNANIPANGCATAIGELIKPKNTNAQVTNGLKKPMGYLTFIDGTSPYGTQYVTRCNRGNFYIETWVNNGSTQDTGAKKMNAYQAAYIANMSAAESEVCSNTKIGGDPGECRDFINGSALVNTGLPKSTSTTSGAGIAVALDERVLTTFPRPEGWFASEQFLKLTGGKLTGNVDMTSNADFNLDSGSTMNLKSGANIKLNTGSEIFLPNGHALSQALLDIEIFTFTQHNSTHKFNAKKCTGTTPTSKIELIPLNSAHIIPKSPNSVINANNVNALYSTILSATLVNNKSKWEVKIPAYLYEQQEQQQQQQNTSFFSSTSTGEKNLVGGLQNYNFKIMAITYCQ